MRSIEEEKEILLRKWKLYKEENNENFNKKSGGYRINKKNGRKK
jgi:hypothetical protein